MKAYRDRLDVAAIVRDAAEIEAAPAERLARPCPSRDALLASRPRNYLPYGRELLDQGLEAAALVAFERAAQANPSASTLYRLGTLLVKSGAAAKRRARPSSARSRCSPTWPRPATTSARCSRRSGDLPGGDRALPGGARARRPTIPTRSTTSATRCC